LGLLIGFNCCEIFLSLIFVYSVADVAFGTQVVRNPAVYKVSNDVM